MARKRKRGGWTNDGVKVREKPKNSGVWWVFVNHDGRRKAYRKGDKDVAEAFANELRAGFKLVEARQRGLTIDELQRIGLAHNDVLRRRTPASPSATMPRACSIAGSRTTATPNTGSSSPRGVITAGASSGS